MNKEIDLEAINKATQTHNWQTIWETSVNPNMHIAYEMNMCGVCVEQCYKCGMYIYEFLQTDGQYEHKPCNDKIREF